MIQNNIELTFIIPAFNEENYIGNLLASICQNITDINYEIIVINNGSTDNTTKIAKRHTENVFNIERSYVSYARNFGANKAKGEILAFLDADIRITPEWQQTLISIKDEVSEGRIITGTRVSVRENPSYIEKNWFLPLSQKETNYINSGNVILSKKTFSLIGGFNTGLETGEDVELCTRARKYNVTISPNKGFKVFHDAFPTTLKKFIQREIWHGKGDYKNLSIFTSSKVALIATFVALLHYAIVLSILYRYYEAALHLLTFVFIIVFIISINIFRRISSVSQSIKNIPITYLYIISRHLSIYSIIRNLIPFKLP